jgi:hypothetical protein
MINLGAQHAGIHIAAHTCILQCEEGDCGTLAPCTPSTANPAGEVEAEHHQLLQFCNLPITACVPISSSSPLDCMKSKAPPVRVLLNGIRHVVVYDQRNVGHINTSPCHIRSNQHVVYILSESLQQKVIMCSKMKGWKWTARTN